MCAISARLFKIRKSTKNSIDTASLTLLDEVQLTSKSACKVNGNHPTAREASAKRAIVNRKRKRSAEVYEGLLSMNWLLRIQRSHWRAVIDGIKSSLRLTSLNMNLLWDGNRPEEDLEIYIDVGNNVDNFLRSKGPHPFPDNATEFCTKGSTKISGVFGHGLAKGYDQPRVAQQFY